MRRRGQPPPATSILAYRLLLLSLGFAAVDVCLIICFIMATPSEQQSAHTPSKGAVSTPDKWPSRDSVTLVVGQAKKAYTLHKDLLCFYSDYFRAAFNGSFKEAAERKIELSDVEDEVFEFFQLWLYTRRLNWFDTRFSILAKLWIFGDQYQMPLLQNCSIDTMLLKRTKQYTFQSEVLGVAYANTLAGSPLRRAVIDLASSMIVQEHANSVLRAELEKEWSVESLIDLVRAIESRDKALPQYSLPKRDKCYYHVHGKDEQCPK
ncbi:hypothetical protein D6D01_09632 [Aureobasidium pullulans]|uniref:BTB domain-containing protein n=1 Tax=Aureobasidium pullulans TaxID=5580 RepID=A0A4S9K032_AURPU|nr:hypothetical protein D6D01_09632 [Aureobasidium pullulans]